METHGDLRSGAANSATKDKSLRWEQSLVLIGLEDVYSCPSGLRVVFVEANEQETKTKAGRAGVPSLHGRLCSGVGRSNFKH